MIITSLIFIILSLILIFFLTISPINYQLKNYKYNLLKIVLNIIIYLIITAFLAYFYSFKGIKDIAEIQVNPIIATISLFLQFINIITFIDIWYQIIVERLNKKFTIYILNIIFNLIIIIGNIMTKLGTVGILSTTTIITNVRVINNLSRIIIYIPFVIYNLNLLNLNIAIRRKRGK